MAAIGNLLPTFTGPSEVEALQKALVAQLATVRASLQRCSDAGTFTPEKVPGAWDEFQGLKQRVTDYTHESPALLSTVSQYERGEALQRELATWHDKARGFGCDVAVVTEPPVSLANFGAGLGTGALLLLAALFFLGKK